MLPVLSTARKDDGLLLFSLQQVFIYLKAGGMRGELTIFYKLNWLKYFLKLDVFSSEALSVPTKVEKLYPERHEIILFIHPCLMFALSQWHYIDLPSAWYLLPSHPLKSCYLTSRFLSQRHSVGCHYENAMLDIGSCSVCLLFPTAPPVCVF